MASFIPPAGVANSFANAHVTLRVAQRSSMEAIEESERATRELAEAMAEQARDLEVAQSQIAVGTTVTSEASSVHGAGAKYLDARAAEGTKSVLSQRFAEPKGARELSDVQLTDNTRFDERFTPEQTRLLKGESFDVLSPEKAGFNDAECKELHALQRKGGSAGLTSDTAIDFIMAHRDGAKDAVAQKQDFVRGEALKRLEQAPAQLMGSLPKELNKGSKDISEVAERHVGMRQVLSDSATTGQASMNKLNAAYTGRSG